MSRKPTPLQIENSKKLYARLYVSSQDLRTAQFYASVLVKNRWHGHPWERRGNIYQHQSAYTTALVVTYGRLFVKSDGWPNFPESLLGYDADEKALHKELIKRRHTIYAHRASEMHEVRTHIIEITPNDMLPIDMDREPSLRLSKKECELFQRMTEKVIAVMKARMDELREFVVDKLEYTLE